MIFHEILPGLQLLFLVGMSFFYSSPVDYTPILICHSPGYDASMFKGMYLSWMFTVFSGDSLNNRSELLDRMCSADGHSVPQHQYSSESGSPPPLPPKPASFSVSTHSAFNMPTWSPLHSCSGHRILQPFWASLWQTNNTACSRFCFLRYIPLSPHMFHYWFAKWAHCNICCCPSRKN